MTATPTPRRNRRPIQRYQSQKQRAAVHTSSTPVTSQPPLQPSVQGFKYDCILCNVKHPLYLCSKFNQMAVPQRSEHLKHHHLCYNCIAPGHKTTECRSLARCKSCQGKHHTMVHRDVATNQTTPTNVSAPPTAASNMTSTHTHPSIQQSLTRSCWKDLQAERS